MNLVLLVELPCPMVAIFIDEVLVDWQWSFVRNSHELTNAAVAQGKVYAGVHTHKLGFSR